MPGHVKSHKWASKEWVEASEELAQLGLIGKIDKASFTVYCMTWGELCELEIEFAERKALARKAAIQGAKASAVTDVFFFTTPTGFQREDPMHKMIVDLRKEVDVYARNFGMNPSSRMRVQPSNMIQPDLFESDKAPAGGQVIAMSGFAKFAGQ